MAVSSKMIRKSCVREQAYNPCILPLSLCVLSEGPKGSFFSLSKVADNLGSRSGDFLRSLDEARRNCFLVKSLNNSLLKFSDYLHKIVYRLELRRWLLLSLKHSLHKGVMFLLPFKKIPYKIFDFLQALFGEIEEHFINFRNFHRFHIKRINNRGFLVNNKK